MKIDECYPEPQKILKCERETLGFLKDDHTVQSHFNDLANHAGIYYFKNKDSKGIPFRFESHFDISKKDWKGYANISSEIVTQDGNCFKSVSYNLTIYENNETSSRVLRKFHFDYAPSRINYRHPHPVFHLHYGGRLSGELKNMNLVESHLCQKFDSPRICYYPISLALLINFVLMEFPDEKNKKFLERSEWRTLIRRNEKLILAPFFKKCHEFFNRKSNQIFISDFCYGN